MQLQPNFIFMGEMKSHVLEGPEGKKSIHLHHPMTNQFLWEYRVQTEGSREASTRAPLSLFLARLSSFHPFGFDLRIDLSSHLLRGTEAYVLLQTNAGEFPIPRSIIYLAKYLNRIFHGRLIIATPGGQLQLRRYQFFHVCC